MRPAAEEEYGAYVSAQGARLVRFAYLLCGDWHRAEDTIQRALTKLYLAWPRLRDTGVVDRYVRRIVVRVLVDDGRLARFRRERAEADPPEPPTAPDPTSGIEDRIVVLDALARLAPRQRAVLVLRFWEDLSVDQVADLLGCSPGTVKSQTARGLVTLRALLTDQFPVSVKRST
jgi:RNA polymerase sigma-70 factor (sigma-E family)